MVFHSSKRAIAATMLTAIAVLVFGAERPVFKSHTVSGRALQSMSDNGHWALGWGAENETQSPILIDIENNKVIYVQSDKDIQTHGLCLTYDVSDDGNIVVGSYESQPAYLDRSTGVWTTLPCSMVSGAVHAVTPDGKMAVGTTCNADVVGVSYTLEQPVAWDLTTNTVITPTDLPTVDPDGNKLSEEYVRFIHISPDGRHIVGQVLGVHYFTFVYDRESENERKWNFIGYTTTDGKRFTKTNSSVVEISPVGMSANGKWLALDARISSLGDEFACASRYDIEKGELTIYASTVDDMDIKAACVDNDGNVYGCVPAYNPIREFLVRCDGYWFSLKDILEQHYGMDFQLATGYTNTGTPLAVSSDGKTFISFSDPQYGENYTMRMSESLVDICKGINLLSNHYISPEQGATFTKVSQIKITFEREVEVIGNQTDATFGEWTSTSSNGIKVDPTDTKTVIVTFRSRTLTAGETYEFKLPAGTLCVKGDYSHTNDDITATYTGRADTPVKVLSVYPADGSIMAKIDNGSSPVQLTMDNQVLVAATASANIYSADGSVLSKLSLTVEGNTVTLSPATTQYLFVGETYKVVVDAGSITDISGSGANEKIEINYEGSYVREVEPDNAILFSCDFNNISSSLATWMLYDNDRLTPATVPASLEFDATNTPWNFSIHDENEDNYCAASHSMYTPAGKSDDWMLTPQIYVPDNTATLSFDVQGYRAAKQDRLKVVVWECDEEYNTLTAETLAKIKAEGEVVFDEQLSPGKEEETLAGDWVNYTVALDKYDDKNIYIAFVNDNNDQSMVFVDNVVVKRDMPYVLTLTNKQAVVNEESAVIGGTVTVTSPRGLPGGYSLTLCDAEGNTIDIYDHSVDGTVPSGDTRSFTFDNPLPLVVGEENNFSIKMTYQEGVSGKTLTDEIKSTVMNLTFKPTKHVVLEEMTGTTCGNCPQGIIVIEKMKEMYGEQFIPISIHTYDGDAWGSGLQDYSNYLGLIAAPTGIVNRSTDIVLPMLQDPIEHKYTMSYYGYLWLDKVAEEMDNPTYIDVTATVKTDAATGRFSLPVTVRSALNTSNQNINVLAVMMEDKLVGMQSNYLASMTDPIFGDWGQGGRYGQSVVKSFVHSDVVRHVYGATYGGTTGLLPQTMVAGEYYSTTISGELPGTCENLDYTKFAVILIDANTDKIINAYVAYTNPDVQGIREVPTTERSSDDNRQYNLAGQVVDDSFKGIVIRGGKKYLKR